MRWPWALHECSEITIILRPENKVPSFYLQKSSSRPINLPTADHDTLKETKASADGLNAGLTLPKPSLKPTSGISFHIPATFEPAMRLIIVSGKCYL